MVSTALSLSRVAPEGVAQLVSGCRIGLGAMTALSLLAVAPSARRTTEAVPALRR